MWLYSDYLTIRKDFIPVFSKEADKLQPTSWKSFIPHSSMKKIMAGMMKALERGSPDDKLSLWIHGAYGTGKTYGAFLLKHLLEDDLNEVDDYLNRYQELKDFWHRLRQLRESGQYLVVYHSSAANITSSLRLLIEIQQLIKEALDRQGYTSIVGSTVKDTILSRLADQDSAFDWAKAFNKHRGKFLDFASPEAVVDRIANGSLDEVREVTDRVAYVLESEGFYVVDRPDVLKKWIKDVIRENNLKGIVFIWDEFTDYFKVNNSTSWLQEIAHLTTEASFYLLLITHRSPDQFRRLDDDTRRRLLERFHNFHFEMKPVTAYQLIGNVIEVTTDPERRSTWDVRVESFWDKVRKAATHVLGDEAKIQDFKRLIPLHPYSAYLLATISRQFSSSQRTLFRFMKEEDEHSFCRFIQEYPHNEWYWFTAEKLWDYFFNDPNNDFVEQVRDVVNYYRSRIDDLAEPNEIKCFKAVMLLIALWRQVPGVSSLRPTRRNLETMFLGTDIKGSIRTILSNLTQEGLINSRAIDGDEEFFIPLMTVDERKINDIKKQLESTYHFNRVVDEILSKPLVKQFNQSGAAGRRQHLVIVSAHQLRVNRERVIPEIKPYQLNVVLVVPEDEDEISVAEQEASRLARDNHMAIIVVIQAPFGKNRWQLLIKHLAHQRYCAQINDAQNERYYDTQVQNVVDGWSGIVRNSRHKLFYADDEHPISGSVGYQKAFEEVVADVFRYGPEKVSKIDPLYGERFGKSGAEIGLGVNTNLMNPYKDFVDELARQGFGGNVDGFNAKPEHPVSQMRSVVSRFFSTQESVYIYEIWERLQEPPYGLIPSPIAITLFGFIMREYAQGYYWSDGVTCFPLNHNKLAELLEAVLKGKRGSEDYSIRSMSQTAEKFCELVRNTFDLPPEKTKYPEDTKKYLRNYLNQVGYPLWALKYALDKSSRATPIIVNAFKELERIICIKDDDDNSLSDQGLDQVVKNLGAVSEDLKVFVAKAQFENGLQAFIDEKDPALSDIMARVNIDLPLAVSHLKRLMNEDVWIWQIEKVEARLPELRSEFYLTDALNQLCGVSYKELDKVIKYFAQEWLGRLGKLPLQVLCMTKDSNISIIIKELNQLVSAGAHAYANKHELASRLIQHRDDIRSALNDQNGALIRWVKKVLKQELADEEAREVLKRLDSLVEERNSEVVKQEVNRLVVDLESGRLVSELRSKWIEITGSGSPAEWSRSNRVPLSLVLSGQVYADLFTVLNDPATKTVSELKKSLKLLQDNEKQLKILANHSYVDKYFLEAVLGRKYIKIVNESHMTSLKERLVRCIGEDVFQWPTQIRRVRDVAEEWVKSFYRDDLYGQVVQRIDAIPLSEAKKLLKSLAEQPEVGILILSNGG